MITKLKKLKFFPRIRKDNNRISKIDTIIGSSTNLKGNLLPEGTIRIDGHLQGDISGADGVIVGKEGAIEGNITAKTVIIGGKVIGNVSASENLEISSSAEVKGDLKYSRISIEEGAIFEGTCQKIDGKEEI